MRKIVVAAWLAVSSVVAAVPAAADSPASLPPLAPGEVLLEVSGIGIARTPATYVLITTSVRAQGETEAAARRAAQEAIGRVTAAARRAGAATADVTSAPLELRREDDYGALFNAVEANMSDYGSEAPTPAWTATSEVTVRLRNVAAAPDLRSALSGQEGLSAGSVLYDIDDDSAARREARADAVRRARADAESYAASIGMRIARVLRVTERTGLESLPMVVTEQRAARRFADGPLSQAEPGFVHTFAVVGIDYALAPAR